MFHLIEDIFSVRIIYDFISYIICFLLLIYTIDVKKFKNKFYLILLISSVSPFFFNNLLFDWYQFPDQSKYLFIAQSIRELDFYPLKDTAITLLLPGIIYSLFPIPVIYSFTTISILSRTFFLITIIYAFKEYKKDKAIIFFLLFCPSIILYSSIGLRETFIFSFLILFFFNLKRNKFYIALIFLSLLILIKAELGLMIILSLIVYYFLFSKINNYLKYIFLFLCLLFIFVFSDIILSYINKRYLGFYHEEFLHFPNIYENYIDIIIELPFKLLNLILSPLFEITNPLRFFQIFENLFIYIFLFLYFKNCYYINKLSTLYWFIIFFLNLSIYSLVVVNPGSIARYKITLFIFIILCLNNFKKKYV